MLKLSPAMATATTMAKATSRAVAAKVAEPATAGAEGGPALDREAFQAFYDRTSADLRRYLRRVSGDSGRAEDVFQESYVRLINRPGLDWSHETLRSYLFRTASNLLRDHWRRARREQRGLLDLMAFWRDRSAPVPSGARVDLDAALGQLDLRDRAMLWLAYVEGYGHRDIAEMLGLKPRSVRVLLFRLRRRLERRLTEGVATDQGDAA